MSASKHKQGSVIISPTDTQADMYVVVQGTIRLSAFPPEERHRESAEKDTFDMLTQMEVFKVVGPSDMFGDYSCFHSDKPWK
jgi:CRP-like cAMP-binding protein